MPIDPTYVLTLVQTGGTNPLAGKFGHGAGLILLIIVAFLTGLVLLALLLAGRKRR